MIAVAERSVEPIGTIQAWETETSYPDETPFVSDLGWTRQQVNPPSPGWLRGIFTDPTPLVTTLSTHTLGDQMGHVWMPWAFAPSATLDIAVSSVGMGVMAAGVVLTNAPSGLLGTTVLPASGILRLMNPGQIMVATTPRWMEADEIRLFAPGLLPRTLRVRDTSGDILAAATDPRLGDALAAITDIGLWLNRSQKDVAELCRFSLRASRYWGSGKTASPRPSTVRHLFEVHSFLGSLVRSLGRQEARFWLGQPCNTGALRLDVLAQEDGIKVLLREAAAVLFAEAPAAERPLPESVVTAETGLDAETYVAAPHRARPRRARRAPRRGD